MIVNRNFAITLLLTFFNSGGAMILVITSLFFNDISFDTKTISILTALFGIGAFLGGYIGGYLSDIIMPKNVMSISILGNASFIFLLSISQHILLLLGICMFCIGLFNSGFRPSAILMLLNTRGNLSTIKVLAYRKVVFNLGFGIFAAGFGFLYSFLQKDAFYFIALLFFVNFLISLFLTANKDISGATKAEASHASNIILFIILNILLVVGTIILNQYQMSYPIFLEKILGLSINQISIIFTIHGFVILLFQIPIGYLFDKVRLSLGCAIGSLLLAIGMGLTYISSNFYIIILLCIVWTVAEMVLFQLILPFILNVSIYKKGKTMGIYQASFSFGSFLAPLFAGFLYTKNPTLLWNACFFLGILCAITFLIIFVYHKDAKHGY
jgi:predicted MFS family arabinose efflux permease